MSETGATILLVDDNSDVIEVVRVILETEGYVVATASDGADALAQLRAGLTPKLIILDLTMPVMDGWEFREHQLADPALRDIPTIIYSAVSSVRRDEVGALRVEAAFDKGADPTAMLSVVSAICRRP
ncbi:response regulator [Candidatus Binatia bacterium]|jgi:CheY-like chemotaxis protein|nr:response regulator [Candidatus Binatia bacterium]